MTAPQQPTTDDGRNVDPSAGALTGEGAQQIVRRSPEKEYPTSPDVLEKTPNIDSRRANVTYYDLPVLKEPVWKISIPLYFYAGGVAGGTMALAAAIAWQDRSGTSSLARRCRWTALGAVTIGTALLIEDLGRPSRFHHMLRVFRPTSPMNVGAWILSAFGGCAAAATLLGEAPGAVGTLGRRATITAGAIGLGLTSYTAVLLSNTAVPVWQGAHRTLPFLFATSSASSAAALLEMFELSEHDAKIIRRYAVASKLAELVCSTMLDRDIARQPGTSRPLRQGFSGALWKIAKGCTAASLVMSMASTRSRSMRRAAGVVGTVGALALRLGIFRAGVSSARDPRATFDSQRAGFGAAEVTGVRAVTSAAE